MDSTVIALWISTGAAVISALYGFLSYHAPRSENMSRAEAAAERAKEATTGRRRLLIAIVFPVLAWLGVFANWIVIHSVEPDYGMLMQSYGWSPQPGQPMAAYDVIDGTMIQKYAAEYDAALILRIAYANVDRMTDTAIVKSTQYTIQSGVLTLAIPAPHLRASFGQMNAVEFDVVVLPKEHSIDEVTKLADVENLGGKILSSRAKGDILNPAPSSPAPPPKTSL